MPRNRSERWASTPVEGYEVSSMGRVRSLDRVVHDIGKGGTPRARNMTGRVLAPQVDGNGYFRLSLGRKNRWLLHRLVWVSFVGDIPKGMQVCHNDGDPSNNGLENLRIDTPKGNASDRPSHGTSCRGSRSPHSILTAEQVLEIRGLEHLPRKEVAQRYGVHPNTITNIIKRRGWTWL